MKKIFVLLAILVFVVIIVEVKEKNQEGAKGMLVKGAAFLFPADSSHKVVLVFIDAEDKIRIVYSEPVSFLVKLIAKEIELEKIGHETVLVLDKKVGIPKFIVSKKKGVKVGVVTNKKLVVTTEDGKHWRIDSKFSKRLGYKLDLERVKIIQEKGYQKVIYR